MASISKATNGYRVRVRVKGFPCASATLPTRDLAQRWATKTEREIIEAKYFGDAYTYTIHQLIDLYLEREAPLRLKHTTYEVQADILKRWKLHLPNKLLAHLKARDILEWRDSADLAPATVNRYIAALSAVLSYGVEREYCADNICRRIRSLPTKQSRDRILTHDEQIALEGSLYRQSTQMWQLFRLSILTGARRGELLNLESGDINYADRTLTFRNTKNGEDRTIPVSQFTLSLCVLPLKYDAYVWSKSLKECNITNLKWHDLRHTFITRQVQAGVNPMHLAAYVGHSSVGMLAHYTHLKPEDLRAIAPGV